MAIDRGPIITFRNRSQLKDRFLWWIGSVLKMIDGVIGTFTFDQVQTYFYGTYANWLIDRDLY